MGTGRRGGCGADELGLQELEGRRLGWAVCSGASWQVNAFVFAAPPSEAGFVSLLGWSLAGPRREPQERPSTAAVGLMLRGRRVWGSEWALWDWRFAPSPPVTARLEWATNSDDSYFKM